MTVRNIKLASWYFLALMLFAWATACFPPVEEDFNSIHYSLKDPQVRNIIELKDKGSLDSLASYLNEKKASYRYLAAMGFASLKDSASVRKLIPLLSDPVEGVRQAAAFAIGQSGQVSAEADLTKAFIAVDSAGEFNKTNSIILEALGKCGYKTSLDFLCQISSYTPNDTLLVYGQIMAFYRFGIRQMFCPDAAEKLVKVATNEAYPESVRLAAAHCLQRFKNLELSSYTEILRKSCNDEKNPLIRMCIVSALGRIQGANVLNALEELYSRGLDLRIQTNLIKALGNHTSLQAQNFALKVVQNPSVSVASQAAQYLVEKGSPEIFEELKKLCEQKTLPWQVRCLVFESALRHVPYFMMLTRNELLYKVRGMIAASKNPYEKAGYIRALSSHTSDLNTIIAMSGPKAADYVNTTIAECIEKILDRSDFNTVFKGSLNPVYPSLARYFEDQCKTGNPGSLAVMSSIFKNKRPLIEKYFNADSMLTLARQKLSLPRDIETYNELTKCIAKRNKSSFLPVTPAYNHPIDWTVLEPYGDTIAVKLITNKGDISLDLYPAYAPGSVSNFIKLAKDGFYKDKFFHRVVPNFVVQAGCPRGDGYGSLDYSIRTEISSLNFMESGLVGMASAGANTECTQFFITHSPAPHLDGNYTIFGKIASGNDVLESIYQGDSIQNIEIIDKQIKTTNK